MQNWKPVMPSYNGQVTEDELSAIIAYIRSLKPGKPMPAGRLPERRRRRAGRSVTCCPGSTAAASKISSKSRGIKESGVRRTLLCGKPSSWHAAICDRT